MTSPESKSDCYQGTLAPNLPVLSRAASCSARVSLGKSKKPSACAWRDTNAGRGAVSPWQTGTCTAEAARRSLRSPRRATPMVPATSKRTVGAGSMDLCSSAAIAPSIWPPSSSRARPSAKSSQCRTGGGEREVRRRVDVDLGCGTAAQKHSNTAKQKRRVRAALCANQPHVPTAVQIRKSSVATLAAAAAQKVE